MVAKTNRSASGHIALKRVYEPAGKDDGTRILVDRLWPRGVSTDKAKVDLWLRDIAPSDDLRKWYGHDVDKWPQFRKWYRTEISRNPDLLDPIRDALAKGDVTLLFAAKDEAHNNAVVLKERLERGLKASARARERTKARPKARKASATRARAS
jgi:uncharacterized protein YeaO (DUF488 family)